MHVEGKRTLTDVVPNNAFYLNPNFADFVKPYTWLYPRFVQGRWVVTSEIGSYALFKVQTKREGQSRPLIREEGAPIRKLGMCKKLWKEIRSWTKKQ